MGKFLLVGGEVQEASFYVEMCLEESRSLHKHLQIPEWELSEGQLLLARLTVADATDPTSRVLLRNLSCRTDGGMNRVLERLGAN